MIALYNYIDLLCIYDPFHIFLVVSIYSCLFYIYDNISMYDANFLILILKWEVEMA